MVLAPDDQRVRARTTGARSTGKLEPLYCGGETRRDSVYNGLVAAMAAVEADDWMLVHDAARPCLPRKDLETLMRETQDDEVGGILALPVADTVKRAAKDEAVRSAWPARKTAPSSGSRRRRRCSAPAAAAGAASARRARRPTKPRAVEQMGLKPRLVAGSRENLKVTWPEDLAIAESILKGRA